MISKAQHIELVNRLQGCLMHALDWNSGEIMNIVKMICNDTCLVLCIFDKLVERKWTGSGEELRQIRDKYVQEHEQGVLLVLMT